MKNIIADMIQIYGITDRDWMNFKIYSKSSLSYHHIIKVEDGGKTTIKNGAILTKKAHDLLHCIEYHNITIYDEINKIFNIINKNVNKCSKEELQQIRFLIIKYLDRGFKVPKNLERSYIKKMMLESSDVVKFKIYV